MTSGNCYSCGFPIAVSGPGQTINCPNCKSVNESYQISDISIPTPLFAGAIGFVLGAFLAPALLSGTEEGSRWLQRKAKERLSK